MELANIIPQSRVMSQKRYSTICYTDECHRRDCIIRDVKLLRQGDRKFNNTTVVKTISVSSFDMNEHDTTIYRDVV